MVVHFFYSLEEYQSFLQARPVDETVVNKGGLGGGVYYVELSNELNIELL